MNEYEPLMSEAAGSLTLQGSFPELIRATATV